MRTHRQRVVAPFGKDGRRSEIPRRPLVLVLAILGNLQVDVFAFANNIGVVKNADRLVVVVILDGRDHGVRQGNDVEEDRIGSVGAAIVVGDRHGIHFLFVDGDRFAGAAVRPVPGGAPRRRDQIDRIAFAGGQPLGCLNGAAQGIGRHRHILADGLLATVHIGGGQTHRKNAVGREGMNCRGLRSAVGRSAGRIAEIPGHIHDVIRRLQVERQCRIFAIEGRLRKIDHRQGQDLYDLGLHRGAAVLFGHGQGDVVEARTGKDVRRILIEGSVVGSAGRIAEVPLPAGDRRLRQKGRQVAELGRIAYAGRLHQEVGGQQDVDDLGLVAEKSGRLRNAAQDHGVVTGLLVLVLYVRTLAVAGRAVAEIP